MSENRPPIIMYGRQTFCPDVARSRLRLEELGYDWIEYNVEADPGRKEEMAELTGRGNVPTLIIGDRVLVEPSNDLLDKALLAAGYELDTEE
jgi:glutaredoxin